MKTRLSWISLNRLRGKTTSPLGLAAILLSAALACSLPAVQAAGTWNGLGADNNFATAGNWVGGVAPGTPYAGIVMSGNTTTSPTFTAPATFSAAAGVQGLLFDATTTAAFTFSGSALTFSSSSAGNATIANVGSTFTQTFDNPITMGANALLSGSGAGSDLTFSGTISGGANGFHALTAGGSAMTFNGVISGGGDFRFNEEVAGAGTIRLNNANTLTGRVFICTGVVVTTGALANGGLASGIGASSNVSGNLRLRGGTLQYTGAAQSTDRLFELGVAGGTLDSSGSGALSFTNTGAMGLDGIGGARTLTLTGTNADANTLAAGISNLAGSTSLIKSGSGNWTLSGNSDYSGTTTVSGGTLGLSATVTGTSITVNGATANFVESSTGVIAGVAKTFTLTSGTATLGGNNTYTGMTTVSGGTLNLTGTLAGTNIMVNNATASFNESSTGVIAGGVALDVMGTTTLAGVNTYTGSTKIRGGFLTTDKLANGGTASGIGASTNAETSLYLLGGTLQYTGAAQSTDRLFSIGILGGILDASGSGAVNFNNSGAMGFADSGAHTLTLTGTNVGANTLAAVIGNSSGATSFTKSGVGTWVLSGANTYTGATTITAGTLILASTGTIANSSGVNLGTSGSQGTLDLTSKASYAFGAGQTVSGFGTINIGAGKTVTIAHLAPGNSPGQVSVTGSLIITTDTTMELAGSGGVKGTDFDNTTATEALTYGGTLSIVSFGGFNINQVGTYSLFDFSSQSGNFSSVSVGGTALVYGASVWTGSNSGFDYSFALATGDLTVVPEPVTWALLAFSLTTIMVLRRRSKKA